MGVSPSGGAVAGIGTIAGLNQNRPSNRHGYRSSRPSSSLLVPGGAAKRDAKGFVKVQTVEAVLPVGGAVGSSKLIASRPIGSIRAVLLLHSEIACTASRIGYRIGLQIGNSLSVRYTRALGYPDPLAPDRLSGQTPGTYLTWAPPETSRAPLSHSVAPSGCSARARDRGRVVETEEAGAR